MKTGSSGIGYILTFLVVSLIFLLISLGFVILGEVLLGLLR